MTIHSEIQFDKVVNNEKVRWTVAFDDLTIPKIEEELNKGAHAAIINRFEGKVPLHEMMESTTQSVKIMEQTSSPVDIIAVMERGSSLGMSISDMKKTSEILDFAKHPRRGATVAVMYEKTVTKFFLTIANQLLPGANFVLASNMDEAYAVIEKYRNIHA